MNGIDNYPLDWIPGFIESIRPYIHVRREDSLLILLPNEAYKLNATAIDTLEHLFDGGSLEDLLKRWKSKPVVKRDMYYFFCDLKALVSGCFGDGRGRKAVTHIPMEVPFTKLPVLSEIAVTYRCNLACRFCYAGCNCRKLPSACREMSTAEVKKVLKIIKHDADVPSVSFTGGEPTLRDDLPELIEYARDLGLRVNLISNGTLITDELADKFVDSGLNSAQISIEGPDDAIHDGMTQVRGSFIKTLDGIERLISRDIFTQTNTTINALNAEHVVRIVDLLADHGLKRLAMNMLTPSGSAVINDEVFISYTEIGKIVKRVQERAAEKGLKFLWYSPTPYCMFNPVVNGLGNKGCAACDGLLSLDPQGNILPCSSFDSGVGNILHEDFQTIWNSAQAVFWRHKQYAPSRCKDCETLIACAAACPLYWDYYGTEELDSCVEEVAS